MCVTLEPLPPPPQCVMGQGRSNRDADLWSFFKGSFLKDFFTSMNQRDISNVLEFLLKECSPEKINLLRHWFRHFSLCRKEG